MAFVEDRTGPPNRAYLKLWEALVRLGRWPGPGERCLDLGASPGGWTWVLARLGADGGRRRQGAARSQGGGDAGRRLARRKRLCARRPRASGAVDWLFSDIVCYPARLLRLVETWRSSGLVRNFVCTIKFQGETDHESAAAFAAIPGAQVVHLHHNKHELTFLLIR